MSSNLCFHGCVLMFVSCSVGFLNTLNHFCLLSWLALERLLGLGPLKMSISSLGAGGATPSAHHQPLHFSLVFTAELCHLTLLLLSQVVLKLLQLLLLLLCQGSLLPVALEHCVILIWVDQVTILVDC